MKTEIEKLLRSLENTRASYYFLLLVFIFYERGLFDYFFRDLNDFVYLFGIIIGISLIYGLLIKKIPTRSILYFILFQSVVIGTIYYLMGFILPVRFHHNNLNWWFYSMECQIFLGTLHLGLLPISLYEIFKRIDKTPFEQMEKENRNKIPRNTVVLGILSVTIGGIFSITSGIASLFSFNYGLISMVIPTIIMSFYMIQMLQMSHLMVQKGNEINKKPLPLNPIGFLNFACKIAIIGILSFSTTEHNKFLYNLILYFGFGIIIYSVIDTIFVKVSKNANIDEVMLFITYAGLLISVLITLDSIKKGMFLEMDIGISPILAGFGYALICSTIELRITNFNRKLGTKYSVPIKIDKKFQEIVRLSVILFILFLMSIVRMSPNGGDNEIIFTAMAGVIGLGIGVNLISWIISSK